MEMVDAISSRCATCAKADVCDQKSIFVSVQAFLGTLSIPLATETTYSLEHISRVWELTVSLECGHYLMGI